MTRRETPGQLTEYSREIPRARISSVNQFFKKLDLESPTIIREVLVIPPRLCLLSLASLLKKTDRELELVAELSNAKVVGHRWGLVDGRQPLYRPMQLPKYKTLVAEVDRIEIKDSPTLEQTELLDRGIKEYNQLHGRYRLGDISSGQFIFGVNQNTPTPSSVDPELYLVDIEPVFRTLHLREPPDF